MYKKNEGGEGYACALVIKLQVYSVGQYFGETLGHQKCNLSCLHMN